MTGSLFEIAKKIREILAEKSLTEGRQSSMLAAKYLAAYLEANPMKQNEILRKETLEEMMADIKSCGFFRPEKYDLLEKIIPKVGGYNNDPFSYNDCLNDEEKVALHIDTEYKVSREMVECMNERGLSQKDPRNIIPVIYYMNYFAVGRKYKLLEFKARGIEKVKIVCLGGDMDCKAVEHFKKTYPLDSVPALPLPECDAPYCRCEYVAGDE
ncbi:MAG: hypothetical protein LBK27_04820 [Treponema sp.]|jgi:hypothetical protein|nr:hypothetical protein [Treponema sp.]